MLTLSDFLHPPPDARVDVVAGIDDPTVMKSYHTALSHIRMHLKAVAIYATTPGYSHHDMCYNFHVATSLLIAILDGLALYVEKKLQQPPAEGNVGWDGPATFIDPRFAELRAIKDRTARNIIPGGLTLKALRNLTCRGFSTSLRMTSDFESMPPRHPARCSVDCSFLSSTMRAMHTVHLDACLGKSPT